MVPVTLVKLQAGTVTYNKPLRSLKLPGCLSLGAISAHDSPVCPLCLGPGLSAVRRRLAHAWSTPHVAVRLQQLLC